MTLTTLLYDNFHDLFKFSSHVTTNVMKGGKFEQRKNPFMLLLIILLMILIKGFIVYLLYNSLVPKLIYSLNLSNRSLEDIINNFRPLSYNESILLVIFFNTLFTF